MCVERVVLDVFWGTGFCLVVVMIVEWPVAVFFVVVVVVLAVAVVVVAERVQMANLDPY